MYFKDSKRVFFEIAHTMLNIKEKTKNTSIIFLNLVDNSGNQVFCVKGFRREESEHVYAGQFFHHHEQRRLGDAGGMQVGDFLVLEGVVHFEFLEGAVVRKGDRFGHESRVYLLVPYFHHQGEPSPENQIEVVSFYPNLSQKKLYFYSAIISNSKIQQQDPHCKLRPQTARTVGILGNLTERMILLTKLININLI